MKEKNCIFAAMSSTEAAGDLDIESSPADAVRSFVTGPEWQKYLPLLKALSSKLNRNRTLQEDIIVQTRSNAWQKADTFRGDCTIPSWIRTIAQNVACDLFRSTRKGDQGLNCAESSMVARDLDDPVDSLIEAERGKIVRLALKELKPIYQEVIGYRYYGMLTYDEISRELQIPIGTVKSRLADAKNYLRESLLSLNQRDAL